MGESRDRDAEYEALYRDILPELDPVLWLIKADDRALSVDEYFWRHILHRGHQQVLFVVTQADKTEPCHEWDMAGIQPSRTGTEHSRKNGGGIPSVPARTSGCGRIGPHRLGTGYAGQCAHDSTSRPCRQSPDDPPAGRAAHGICPGQAREQFTGAVDRIFDTAESVCVASVARTVLRAVRDTVVSVARAVWNWIFF